MGVLTSAVLWWEESQLRVLLLSSLFIQFLLLIFSFVRRVAIPGWFRFIAWLAYLGGDAMAIYALATLFNRHKVGEQNAAAAAAGGGAGSGSTLELEVIWAPVLLLHLGGHDGITAYNIEDNELWTRHLLTAVAQITVAIYVFCKSWPPGGDKWLLAAAVLLFVPGVFKCFVKPWALKSASIYSLVTSPAAVKLVKQQKEGGGGGGELYPLEEYVKRAKHFVTCVEDDQGRRRPRRNDMLEPAGSVFGGIVRRRKEMLKGHNETCKLFVDLSSSYSRRLSVLEDFCRLTEDTAYGSVRQGLATAFLLLYTKLKTVNLDDFDDEPDVRVIGVRSIFSGLMQLSRSVLPLLAIFLFNRSRRERGEEGDDNDDNDIDVQITYILLGCTAALECLSIVGSTSMLTSMGEAGEEWPEMVAQRSFIGYVARSNDKMQTLSRLLGCGKDFLEQQHWCIRPCFSSRTITRLVHQYLKAGWTQKMHDAASYRRFNDNRGHWALQGYQQELGWSIKGPFDECVLLWHIATDFCFFLSPSASDHICDFDNSPPRWFHSDSDSDSDSDSSPSSRSNKCRQELTDCKSVLCRQMSNYMAYLLLVNPEMLLPGSRRNLFTTAQEELEAIFKNNTSGGDSFSLRLEKPPPDLRNTELALKIISKLESSSQGFQETLILEAWMLAQKLQSLGDEKKMWEVIQGVWVEMLCYSAGRCRGYLHAKALGDGGEFLSYVWLLLFYMGMETFTDKLHREEQDLLPSNESAGNNAAIPPPSTSKVSITTTTASTSDVHTDAGASTAPSTFEICMAQDDMV